MGSENFKNYSVCLFYKSIRCILVILLSSLVVVVVLARMEGSLLLFQKKYFTIKGKPSFKKIYFAKKFHKVGGWVIIEVFILLFCKRLKWVAAWNLCFAEITTWIG